MDVNSNITGVCAEPGFHPEARYESKIDVNGADVEELPYAVGSPATTAPARRAEFPYVVPA
ncbi:hypothetical protein [Catenulispora subtropica]|uniref:Uncharacterized protein n=1 Tax=Catenulispora subtropica TaxID=450798 RepID=A0ABP5DTH9_9ACTN